MKSSSGAHFIALDHVRALAALMVVTWHFIHATNGYPVTFDYVPAIFPLAVLDEGHTGVALFMTLSGYLFAKLLDGKSIDYRAFIWNRAMRLLPLLIVVILLVGLQKLLNGESIAAYAQSIAQGLWLPSLPNGGWSITVEFHYYLILPLLLWMLHQSQWLPFSVIGVALVLRWFLHQHHGEIQFLAYATLVGRIDQFVLGMLAYHFSGYIARRHVLVLLAIVAFTAFYWFFDQQGGFFRNPSYPSPSPIWIFMPTIEGLVYAIGIAWYDNSFAHSQSLFSKFVARLGEYSYSIYLLHFFVVFEAARFVHEHIMDISNFYLACVWALFFFVLMLLPGYVSFRLIEAPFLRHRRRYIKVPGA